ncbi:hypothetical protein [Solimonas sp. SE-A11]|uniref:hypothetical protein n=1 Tax=Solimonas sp. SE-A11 TaxID=3054954 RepID=UPI00259C6DBC|nr:hypothetical protein [Solimonas sp. SE-A11]MDM4770330.1 hypothetical protein [Solimonas sp. SE-A11]
MKAILKLSLVAACLLGTACSSTGGNNDGSGVKQATNLSISPGTAANFFFCFPGNPQWQYVGSAEPKASRKATTPSGAPLGPTLDFNVTTASVVYLRMDLGDVLGEPEAATATGHRHAVAVRFTAGRQYKLDWQVSADLNTTKGRLIDLGNQLVTEAVPITRNICR